MLDNVGANEAEDVVDDATLLIPVLDVGATVLEVEDVELELKLATIRGFQKRGYHKFQLESAVQEAGLQHYTSKQHRP
jgi:hypothetical protein